MPQARRSQVDNSTLTDRDHFPVVSAKSYKEDNIREDDKLVLSEYEDGDQIHGLYNNMNDDDEPNEQ